MHSGWQLKQNILELNTINQPPLWLKGNKIKHDLNTIGKSPLILTTVYATESETPVHQLLKWNIFLDIQIEKSPHVQYMQIPVKELMEDSILPAICLTFLSFIKFPF